MKLVRVLFIAFLMIGSVGCGNQADDKDTDDTVLDLDIEMPGEGDDSSEDSTEKGDSESETESK